MRREVSLEEISDGKLYTANDMVRAGCHDCEGCSACCSGMGSSLILDPYDICQLTDGLHTTFMELMNGKFELNVVDGVILPNMAMAGSKEACGFLGADGRCSVHEFRPGICRLFPLGRYYENGTFRYILQTGECKRENRTKVKIKSFLGIPDLKKYEEYIMDWHRFLKNAENKIRTYMADGDEAGAKSAAMNILNTFFVQPYSRENFYDEYYERRRGYEQENEIK